MNYLDNLPTDILRIKEAKRVLRDNSSLRRDRTEAIRLIEIYRNIAEDMKENEEYRERAEEILIEIRGVL